jgi:hypothetical protein
MTSTAESASEKQKWMDNLSNWVKYLNTQSEGASYERKSVVSSHSSETESVSTSVTNDNSQMQPQINEGKQEEKNEPPTAASNNSQVTQQKPKTQQSATERLLLLPPDKKIDFQVRIHVIEARGENSIDELWLLVIYFE